MEQKNKRKSSFAILLVREKADGTISQHHVSSLFIELLMFFLFLVTVVAICEIIYQSIVIRDMREDAVNDQAAIAELSEQNVFLEEANSDLSDKVEVLSETTAKLAAVEEVRQAELTESYLPKGFPLSGSSGSGSVSMEESEEDSYTLILNASVGNAVVTVGPGIVEAIEKDEKYGTKLVFDHQNGYRSIYYNQGTPLVKEGEALGKRYILFLVGEDNLELAYQIMKDDEYIDPRDVMEISG